MKFDFKVAPATFVARPNRFVVEAQLGDGQIVRTHCADPGRLCELLLPGARLYVSPARTGTTRRTDYDLRFVEHPASGVLVSLDTRIPNQLVATLLADRQLAPLHHAKSVRAEVAAPIAHSPNQVTTAKKIRSRFDFHVCDHDGTPCWIEVKSVTLVENGIALFPDAPTVRGQRHLDELAAIVQAGLGRAAVFFIVQRDDARELRPHTQRDPAFAVALANADAAGVELYAYSCTLTTEKIDLGERIPLLLDR